MKNLMLQKNKHEYKCNSHIYTHGHNKFHRPPEIAKNILFLSMNRPRVFAMIWLCITDSENKDYGP